MSVLKGPHVCPSCPHWLLASQYVEVHETKELAGVRNDCEREKNANPMIYAITRIQKSQGVVSRRVSLISVDSIGTMRCVPAIWASISSKGRGAM